MKIIKRYIFSEFFNPFLWGVVFFISLFWIIDLFEHLDEIVKANVPLFVLCDYYLSITPSIFVKMSPIIIILTAIFTFSRLNRHNEILAVKACGINLWSIINIFLIFGLLMSAISFGINELVSPDSSLHAEDLKEGYFKSKSSNENKILKNITFYGSDNRIFIINSFDPKRQQMTNVIISEHDELNYLLKQIVAKKAVWLDEYWLFYDCIISEYNNHQLIEEPLHYAEKIIFIDVEPKDIKRANSQSENMSYWQLKKYIRQLKNNGFNINKELVIFYNKLAFPLANFIIIFFAVPFTLTYNRNANILPAVTVSIAICFSYWAINAVSLSLGKIGIISPLLSAWLPNIIFFLTGIILIESVKK